jgi:hypothetical protein
MRARSLALALLLLTPFMLRAQAPASPASPASPAAPAAPAAPATPATPAAAPPPSTDVWIADLARAGDRWTLSAPRNLTLRPGYDNQPSFLPDGGHLLYTSQRGEQTDIFEVELSTGVERAVTATAESEYSPTALSDGAHLAVVRVEPDGTQRLWRFPLAGAAAGAPEPIAPEVRGVGYQAWLDPETVAVFVLGEPFTLQILDLRAGTALRVAEKIGRSIHRVPGARAVSFTAPDGDGFAIFTIDATGGSARRLAPAPASDEKDYVWTPDGVLVAAVDARLFRLQPGVDAGWIEFADLAPAGVKQITRLALSPDGSRLAFVASE